jgi:methylmalonyl-CoA carboxyltransferase large subunit
MGAFLLTLVTGAAAGALTARFMVRREVAQLREMLRPAPAPAASAPAPVAAPAPAAPAISEEITPEILMVLSAAVAAFLGKRARIRGARPAPAAQSNLWAQQGRVFVQASHNLPHGRR